MRRGQEAQRELGLGADGVEPWRVDDDEAAAQQRVRVIDDGVAPGRHFHQAVLALRRVVIGVLVVPQAELCGLVDTDALRARHRLHRAGQRIGVIGVERHLLPGIVTMA